MAKNIVICCDGTGNQVEGNLSNVLKLFQIVEKTPPSVSATSRASVRSVPHDAWTQLKQNTKAVLELATGYGLDDEFSAHTNSSPSNMRRHAIFLFGFSRCSYTVRALAAFIHMVGLLYPDQANISDYALTSYKQSSEQNNFHLAWDFSRITGARSIAYQIYRRLGYCRVLDRAAAGSPQPHLVIANIAVYRHEFQR